LDVVTAGSVDEPRQRVDQVDAIVDTVRRSIGRFAQPDVRIVQRRAAWAESVDGPGKAVVIPVHLQLVHGLRADDVRVAQHEVLNGTDQRARALDGAQGFSCGLAGADLRM